MSDSAKLNLRAIYESVLKSIPLMTLSATILYGAIGLKYEVANLSQGLKNVRKELKKLSGVGEKVKAIERRNKETDDRVDNWYRTSWPELRERVNRSESRIDSLERTVDAIDRRGTEALMRLRIEKEVKQ